MTETPRLDREAVRAFVASHGTQLELAQAQGVLARTKLDLKDAAEAAFPPIPEAELGRFERMLNEEVEAFCVDRRLASVTVQTQVERSTRMGVGLALFLALIIGAAVSFFGMLIGFAVAGGGGGAIMLLFAGPVAAIVAFIYFRTERTTASIV